MQFQFDIASSTKAPAPQPQFPVGDTVPDLLRLLLDVQREQLQQIVEVQREHLAHVRATSPDNLARWRNLLNRWQEEHPEFAERCTIAYPVMEKAYVQLLDRMVQELAEQEEDTLDNEFAIQEFIDRYGMRVGQLSHLLSIVGPLSDAAKQNDAAKQQQQQGPPPQAQG